LTVANLKRLIRQDSSLSLFSDLLKAFFRCYLVTAQN
jgi:hypothetical protein